MSTTATRDARRLVIEIVVVVATLALLCWTAEALARTSAERLLQRNVQQVTGVTRPPEVSLGPGLVLPQAIRGTYADVRVSVEDLRSGPLRLERVDTELTNVHLPLRDLLLQDSRRVAIESSNDTARLTLVDLNRYFDLTGRSLRISQQRDDQLSITGEFDVLGRTVRVRGPVELGVDGTQLLLTPTEIDIDDADLSRFDRLLLQQRLDLSVPLDTLPFGNQLTSVRIAGDTLVLTATSAGPLILRP